ITVVADHRLTVRVLLNGLEALSSRAAPDVNRHQLAVDSEQGVLRGRLLPAMVQTASVTVEESVRFQEMLGWGGTTTPPAFGELSPRGQQEWKVPGNDRTDHAQGLARREGRVLLARHQRSGQRQRLALDLGRPSRPVAPHFERVP